MEEILRKLTLQPPPQGLRERVLTAARAELKQAGEKQDWLDRLWESHAYWYSSAAAVLVCLIALFLAPDGAPSRQVVISSANPTAAALAKELARALGDGPALERQLTVQLSGTAVSGGDRAVSPDELLRSIQ